MKPPSVHSRLKTALQHQQAGRFQEAETIYRRVLSEAPANFDALHLLGLLNHQTGRHEQAVELINRAVRINTSPEALNNLGEAFRALNQLEEAQRCYRNALARKPDFAEAYYNLGTTLHGLGRLEEAADAYHKASGIKPGWPLPFNGLGNVLYDLGRFEEAEAVCRRALSLKPDFAAVHYLLGNLLLMQKRFEEAIASYNQTLVALPGHVKAWSNLGNALQAIGRIHEAENACRQSIVLNPDNFIAYNNLGNIYKELGRLEEAEQVFRQALELKPDFVEVCSNLGTMLKDRGRTEEADELYRRALRINPGFIECHVHLAMLSIPIIASSLAQSSGVQDTFSKALDELEDDTSSSACWGALGGVIERSTPFYLAYRMGNHSALLRRYGALVCRAREAWLQEQTAKQPEYATLEMPRQRNRVRLVIVSGQVRRHSVWDVLLHGLLKHIDRSRFEVILYHTSLHQDEETGRAQSLVDTFVQGSADWLQQMASDAPDIIFYPEIGMDPAALKLASLRLAPLQVASWGHPITTGLPTIDLYTSGELLERSDADADYCEKLIRLPGTGACTMLMPYRVTEPVIDGFPPDPQVPHFLICQQVMKFDPAYDTLYPRIARATGSCCFWFSRDRRFPWAARIVEERIRKAFESAGLDPAEYVRTVGWMPGEQFWGLLDKMDIYLDTPAFSGYTTAWQAVHRGLPVVTLEGRYLRQRLAAGLLRRIGVTGTIAANEEQYISMAAALARSAEGRQTLRNRLREAAPLADDDITVVRCFETALLEGLASRKNHC